VTALLIAIDGPSGSGKSTVSQRVASRLGLRYLDSGALYRAVTLHLLLSNIPPQEGGDLDRALERLELTISDEAGPAVVRMAGEDVSSQIRSLEVTQAVSPVAALPQVRRFVSSIVDQIKRGGGIVIEGRDIGSVVAPEADVKIFLTASTEVRASRRHSELADASVATVHASVNDRDLLDSTRAVSPLTQVEDAEVIDSSDMGIDDVVEAIVSLAERVQRDQ
jgi:CMP/dCMP kinase